MLNSYGSNKIILILFKEFIKRPNNNLRKNVISNFFDNSYSSERLDNITNVFHINAIVVEQSMFQVWNISHSVHSILIYLFSTIIRVCFKAKIKIKICFKMFHFY